MRIASRTDTSTPSPVSISPLSAMARTFASRATVTGTITTLGRPAAVPAPAAAGPSSRNDRPTGTGTCPEVV